MGILRHGVILILFFRVILVKSQCPVDMSADPCNSGTDPVITMDLTNYASNMACQEVDIKSPNYPGIYGSTLPSNCEWTITVTNPGGLYTLGVDFIDFESETADSLEVEFVTGGVPTQAFIGNSADFLTSYPDPRAKLIAAGAASVVIRFISAAGSTTATGFHLEVLIARNDICNDFTGPSSFVLSAAYPIAVYATRNFPNVDTSNEECVSDVTSPADSAVYVHYADVEQQSLEDFLYIYDTADPAAIMLLRLLSPRRKTSSPADFDSRTTSIQVVWANNPTVHQKGVMIKFSYTVAVDTVVCNDNGVINAVCDCPATLVNPTASCAVATADGFLDVNALTADTTCNPDNANAHELFLSYTEAGSYQLAATGGYYAPGVYDDNAECHWLFTAPTGSELYLIIRDFDVDGDRDRFQFLQRGSNGRIFRFTGDETATNIPYSSGGAMMNFDVINALILGADDRMKVEFVPMTTDGTVGRGVLFEVRVIDPACPTPCVNGGVCVKTCVCNQGYQGAECDEAVNVEVQVITGTVTEGVETVFTLQAMTDVPVLESAVITFQLEPSTTAVDGFDFDSLGTFSCIITFNTDTCTVDIPIINDALTEPGGPELVVVSVASVIGQPAITPGVSATVQIIDEAADTGLVQAVFDRSIYKVNEGDVATTVSLTVAFIDGDGMPTPIEDTGTINLIYPQESTLDTAIHLSDYTQINTISVTASVSGIATTTVVQTITILANTDGTGMQVEESVESFRVNMNDFTGAVRTEVSSVQASSTVLIYDDDFVDFVTVINQPRLRKKGYQKLQFYAVNTEPSWLLQLSKNDQLQLPVGVRPLIIDGSPYGYHLSIDRPRRLPARRFGTYTFTYDSGTRVRTVNAHVNPKSDILSYTGGNTITVYPRTVGSKLLDEELIFGVSYDGTLGQVIKWKRNGKTFSNRGRPLLRLRRTDNLPAIYEISRRLRRSIGWEIIIEIILSDCPRGLYKDAVGDCTNACPDCYNGGVCEVETGMCTCPPCYMGTNCELVQCDIYSFGQSVPILCKDLPEYGRGQLQRKKCQGVQFCYGGLYGCSCGCGFSGLNCEKTCKKGRFGADCSLTCNCVDDLCDPVTGVCENGCDRSYTGDTCQIPLFFNT